MRRLKGADVVFRMSWELDRGCCFSQETPMERSTPVPGTWCSLMKGERSRYREGCAACKPLTKENGWNKENTVKSEHHRKQKKNITYKKIRKKTIFIS